jgi:hypothetical protein
VISKKSDARYPWRGTGSDLSIALWQYFEQSPADDPMYLFYSSF